jgi:DASH complex subunit Spc34
MVSLSSHRGHWKVETTNTTGKERNFEKVSRLLPRRGLGLCLSVSAPRRVAITDILPPTMTTLQPHLDSISATSSSLATLPFNTIPTHFIASLLHQSGVDNLIRDPHPHERGLFTVRPPGRREKENIPLGEEGKVIRTRTERERVSPLLLPKYSSGANVEADVFLKTADSLLAI